MLREISELESIGDSCYNMARTISRKYQGKEDHFNEEQYNHLHQMMGLTDQSLTQMNQLISGRKDYFDVNRCYNIENEINNFRDQLKSQNIIDVTTTNTPMPLAPFTWTSSILAKSWEIMWLMLWRLALAPECVSS